MLMLMKSTSKYCVELISLISIDTMAPEKESINYPTEFSNLLDLVGLSRHNSLSKQGYA